MRNKLTPELLRRFMQSLAFQSEGQGSIYFTGGATALLLGLREQTIDVDLRLDPEPRGAFEAIARIKNELNLNVELASPADFIPVSADWKMKSAFIEQVGQLMFFHFDLRAQALSKIERGYGHDLADARGFLAAAKMTGEEFLSFFQGVKAGAIRYPALSLSGWERKVAAFVEGL